MNISELTSILSCGEDSRHQFKRNATNADGLAAELAAFANSGGGWLFLGSAALLWKHPDHHHLAFTS